MYKFRNLDRVSNDDDLFMPTEAMYFMDTDLPIESIVNGYQTVQVSGRELATPELNVHESNYYDGGFILNRRLPTREIKVKYLLAAKNSTEFRYSFNLLNQQLFTREVFKFYFRDEPEYYWIGAVSAVEEFPSGVNEGFSTFTITCIDPFKYPKHPYEITGSGTFTITNEIPYYTQPQEITFNYTDDVQNTYIQDGNGHEIFIEGSYSNRDEVTVIPNDPENKYVYYFGQPTPAKLMYTSQIQDFAIKKGSTIVTSQNCSVTIKIGGKLL